ncbi:MAG: hypothetical protein Q9207_005943 [Kuettlingeria erythrocarpa]
MADSTAKGESAAWLEQLMVEAIFGSNYIERSGTSYSLTSSLCEAIFRGQHVQDEPPETSAEYEDGVQHLIRSGRLEPGKDPRALVLTSRKEVVQHARAFDFISKAIVQRDGLLTESLILPTHKILMDGINHEDGTPAEEYAGLYRKDVSTAIPRLTGLFGRLVQPNGLFISREKKRVFGCPVAGTLTTDVLVADLLYSLGLVLAAILTPSKGSNKPHKFLHPSAVPRYMKDMITAYRADTTQMTTPLDDPFPSFRGRERTHVQADHERDLAEIRWGGGTDWRGWGKGKGGVPRDLCAGIKGVLG